MTMDIFRIGSE